MKLNLEFKHKFSMWRCWAGIPSCGKQAVVGATQSSTTPCGLCLEHLPLLKDMAWAEAFIPQEITGTLRDALIAEFYRVFPEPEPEPLVPCPVCGEQPKWCGDCRTGDYRCDHGKTVIWTCSYLSEPLARAAWNSMRREPVVSAADAPKTKWQVWNLTHNSPLTATCSPPVLLFDSRDEAIKERDSFRRSFPGYTYEVREVPA